MASPSKQQWMSLPTKTQHTTTTKKPFPSATCRHTTGPQHWFRCRAEGRRSIPSLFIRRLFDDATIFAAEVHKKKSPAPSRRPAHTLRRSTVIIGFRHHPAFIAAPVPRKHARKFSSSCSYTSVALAVTQPEIQRKLLMQRPPLIL